MKTKKEIYNWWLDRANTIDKNKDDFESFKEEINKELSWKKKRIKKGYFVVEIMSANWENPMYITFYYSDENKANCFNISGF